jgi:hypothetical protein
MRVVFARGATILPTPTRGGGLVFSAASANTDTMFGPFDRRGKRLLGSTDTHPNPTEVRSGSSGARRGRTRREAQAGARLATVGPETSSRTSRRGVPPCASSCAPTTSRLRENVDQTNDEKRAFGTFFPEVHSALDRTRSTRVCLFIDKKAKRERRERKSTDLVIKSGRRSRRRRRP